MPPSTTKKHDIHQDITNNIITLLDQVNLEEYEPPFANLAALGIPENPTTNKQYQGINILALWFNQSAKSFSSNKWATYKQWQSIGAQVKAEQKRSRIIFYKTLIKEDKNEQGESKEQKIPMLRQYDVFNADQVEGYEDESLEHILEIDKVERSALIDSFCKSAGADIRSEDSRAFYSPMGDYINMPDTRLFVDTKHASASENYYSTLLHEMTHWTGNKKRLDRQKDAKKKHIENYAYEELIAELGAAFLCAQFNIKQTQPKDHALYIKSWLTALRNDKTLIFKASAQAAKATGYLNDLQPEGI